MDITTTLRQRAAEALADRIVGTGTAARSVTIGDIADRSTWSVELAPEVTPAARTAVDTAVAAFDAVAFLKQAVTSEAARVASDAPTLVILARIFASEHGGQLPSAEELRAEAERYERLYERVVGGEALFGDATMNP